MRFYRSGEMGGDIVRFLKNHSRNGMNLQMFIATVEADDGSSASSVSAHRGPSATDHIHMYIGKLR